MKRIIWQKWKDILSDENAMGQGKVVIPTPMGVISHKIGAGLDGDLKFVVGNANFDIDEAHFIMMKNVCGVEMINVWSPYTFRVCIGKAFNIKQVLKDIEKSVNCYHHSGIKLTEEQKTSIKLIKANISNNKFWAIYILPNGSFEYYAGNNNKEFTNMYQLYHELEDKVGGKLLSPTNYKVV